MRTVADDGGLYLKLVDTCLEGKLLQSQSVEAMGWPQKNGYALLAPTRSKRMSDLAKVGFFVCFCRHSNLKT